MPDLVVGVLAVAVGALLCFRGYVALRLVIAVWGAFAGFAFGAGVVAEVTGDAFLATPLGWIAGALAGLAFGVFAYVFYAVSVVIGMGAIGFALGTTAMVAIGVTWSWVVVLVGIAVGVALAILAIAGDLPLVILAVLGAFAGASTLLAGVLLLTGELSSTDLMSGGTTQALQLSGWWTAAYVALVLLGLVVQLRTRTARRGTLRGEWAA